MQKKIKLAVASLAALAAAACASGAGGSDAVTADAPHIASSVAAPARPAADTELDQYRKPAEMLAFAGVKPGMKIGELIPGGGYMTRVFSGAVGPAGKVYLFNSAPNAQRPPGFLALVEDKANYPNLAFIQTDFTTIPAPEPLDLVWTSQNYHDMHNPGRNLDINAANKAVYGALKPGGVYVVLDHQSADGVEFDAQLHRIDREKVKNEVLAAGFEYAGESDVLRNPADPRTAGVFDASIRRKTDQFILKFRKPA